MSKIIDAFKKVVFNGYEELEEDDRYDDDEEYYDEEEYDDYTPAQKQPPTMNAANIMSKRAEKAKVIPINGGEYEEAKIRTQILKAIPKCFEDVSRYADLLKDGKVVIINFEEVDSGLAQKIMDFLSGVSYIVGGSIEMINKTVFVFAPPNTEFIVNAIKNDATGKAHLLPWLTASR